MKRCEKAFAFLLTAVFCLGLSAASWAQEGSHVQATLLAELDAAVPGEELWVALKLDHQPHWHTYWLNPGDAGKPTEIAWQLPAGVSAGDIHWPVPERFDLPADLVDFGYTGEVYLLVPVQVPQGYSAASLPLIAQVQWLECEDICIPGSAELNLNVPVAATARINSGLAATFTQARAALPRTDVSLDAMYSFQDGKFSLVVQAIDPLFAGAKSVTYIPDQHGVVDYLASAQVTTQVSSMQLSQAAHRRVARAMPEHVGGLLLVTEESGATQVYPFANAVRMDVMSGMDTATDVDAVAPMGLASVFVFAMLGGMILNLMPCVFPILSLKALSLASASHGHLRVQRLQGLVFSAGVMLSFVSLAAILLALQATGAAVGWGFHLQQPWFIALLIFLFFVMGLSLSGVVDFGTSIMGMGSGLQDQSGYKGSFFTGVLAVVVSSPCTAPFMGAALGFAFTQPAYIALTVFLALGFGMALPFLLLSCVPSLRRILPRPGQWMVTFRQILAFPLYATAVWFLWVLGQQAGSNAMALVSATCVLLAFTCWVWQKRHMSEGGWRHVASVVALLSLAIVLAVVRSPFLQTSDQAGQNDFAGEYYEPYTEAKLASLRAAGKPVFVNMTASWCITCLINEKVALSTQAVRSAMTNKEISYLKGDWTNNDPAITKVLREFKTSGVPLYLLYPANTNGQAEVLPQLLTESMMLEALAGI